MLANVKPPIATDAQGQDVPVSMDVGETSLVLRTPHSGGDFAYPILVDPQIEVFTWGASTTGLDKWFSWANTAYAGSTSIDARNYCGSSCAGYYGLFLASPPGSYAANAERAWKWDIPHFVYSTAPGHGSNTSSAYIERVDFNNIDLRTYGGNAFPFLRVGIWDYNYNYWLASKWINPGAAGAPAYGSTVSVDRSADSNGLPAAEQGQGEGLIFGLWHPFNWTANWTTAYAGGSTIYLNDPEAPAVSMTGYSQPAGPADSWLDTGTPSLAVHAQDQMPPPNDGRGPGLGIKYYNLFLPKDGGQYNLGWHSNYTVQQRDTGCSGGQMAPCPTAQDQTFNYSTNDLAEGIVPVYMYVYDALWFSPSHVSPTPLAYWTAIDHSPPSATVTGGLKTGNGYDLRVQATDGSIGTQQVTDLWQARSGVKRVEVQVDGATAHVLSGGTSGLGYVDQPCTSADNLGWYSCSMDKSFTLDPSPYPDGDHEIKVVSTDQRGHPSEQHWNAVIDHTAPTVTSIQTTADDTWIDGQSYAVVVGAHDAGRGIHDLTLDLPGGQQLAMPPAACTGGNCPRDVNYTFNVDASQFPQGIGDAAVYANGPGGQESDPSIIQLRVDHTVPELSTTGSATNLQIDATDGASGTKSTADRPNARSGVKSLETLVDGNRISYAQQSCPDPTWGSCGVSRGDSFDPNQYSGGDHAVDVVATDQLGHSKTRHLTFTVTKPNVTASGPLLDTSTPIVGLNANVTVDIHDNGGGVRSLGVSVDGAPPSQELPIETILNDGGTQSCAGGVCDLHYTFNPGLSEDLAAGSHTVSIAATDTAGQTGSLSRVIVLDPKSPRLTVSGPLVEAEGKTLDIKPAGLDIAIADGGASTGETDVKTITVTVDDQPATTFSPNCTADCADPVARSYAYDKDAWGAGPHQLEVIATDYAGNQASRFVLIDHVIPSLDPPCPADTPSVAPTADVVSPAAAEAALPEAAAGPTTSMSPEEAPQLSFDPSFTPADPPPSAETIHVDGTVQNGEASLDSVPAVSIGKAVCLKPTETTGAAREGEVIGDGNAAIYTNAMPATDTVVRPSLMGTTIVEHTRSSAAPSSFTWKAALEPGEQLVQLSDGGIAIVDTAGPDVTPGTVPPNPGTDFEDWLSDSQAQGDEAEQEFAFANEAVEGQVQAIIEPPQAMTDSGNPITVTTTLIGGGQITFSVPPSAAATLVIPGIAPVDPLVLCKQAFAGDPAGWEAFCLPAVPPPPEEDPASFNDAVTEPSFRTAYARASAASSGGGGGETDAQRAICDQDDVGPYRCTAWEYEGIQAHLVADGLFNVDGGLATSGAHVNDTKHNAFLHSYWTALAMNATPFKVDAALAYVYAHESDTWQDYGRPDVYKGARMDLLNDSIGASLATPFTTEMPDRLELCQRIRPLVPNAVFLGPTGAPFAWARDHPTAAHTRLVYRRLKAKGTGVVVHMNNTCYNYFN